MKHVVFKAKQNHGSKKANGHNKLLVVDDELKYEDYKNFWFNRPYMR